MLPGRGLRHLSSEQNFGQRLGRPALVPLSAWSLEPQKPPDNRMSIDMVRLCPSAGVEAL